MTADSFRQALHDAIPTPSITSRRHPLALSAYLMVGLMGLIFITGWLDTGGVEHALFGHLPRGWVWAWEYELLTGGWLGVVSILTKPRLSPKWPDLADLLHFEAIAAFVAASGVTTYIVAIAHVLGWHKVGPTALLLSVLSGGLLYRSFRALSEARHVERLGRVVDAVRSLSPEQLAGTDQPEE